MQQHPPINRAPIAALAALLRRWLAFVLWLLLRRPQVDRATLDTVEHRVRKLIVARAMERIVLPPVLGRATTRPHGAPLGFRTRRGGRDAFARYMRLALPSLRHLSPQQRLRALNKAQPNIDALATRLIHRIEDHAERAPFIIAAPCAFVLCADAPVFAAPCADTS